VACLWPFVSRLRNSRTSSGVMEDKSLVEKLSLNRKSTCSQVLTVFFLGICSMVLKMIVYCLGNFHDWSSFCEMVLFFLLCDMIPNNMVFGQRRSWAWLRYISSWLNSNLVEVAICNHGLPPCKNQL